MSSNPKFHVLAASQKGSYHNEGQPNEDAFYYNHIDNGTLIAAVADGAGSNSAPFSSVGSRWATKFAVTWLSSVIDLWPESEKQDAGREWKELIDQCFSETINHIQDRTNYLNNGANSLQITMDAFATTLLIIVATEHFVAYGQVGDGGIVVQTAIDSNHKNTDYELHQLTEDHSKFANITTFITSEDALKVIQSGFVQKPINGVCLFTDGLARIAFDKKEKEPRQSFLNPLIRIASVSNNEQRDNLELEKYLRSNRVQSRTFDDCCILVAGGISSKLTDDMAQN
ncbi:PP2C family serine/threonine-protein phosphatase [Rhodohalobacter mucosus]|uniref:PPM-type phosphatase domain-containing protein n=1 Tax=Rhodohalobacter mucosus TaxID=2079485 RepID=A0A316TRC4_9BACT|nr:PP2C family serine/threonine-protein phosphatase [Rhodohalobacter mucosus]PWN06368.1 hypothetical protein DDZ15_11140 [Rhodohalobacter mucosus]